MFKYLLYFLWIFSLTILTQVGGIIWLLCWPLFKNIRKKIQHKGKLFLANTLAFLAIYIVLSLSVVPILASSLGRVPLPFNASKKMPLQPLNKLTYFLNRHYVSPQLYNVIQRVSQQVQQQYPGTITAYLDANLPFIDGFPLVPHLSHKDGKKLDLAFFYKDADSQAALQLVAPSFIGYGACEKPLKNEIDQTTICEKRGFWQYGLLAFLGDKEGDTPTYLFDLERTRQLIVFLAEDPKIGKIFIEPHLKSRLQLQRYSKIRFQGCRSVRHDDHIHLQL